MRKRLSLIPFLLSAALVAPHSLPAQTPAQTPAAPATADASVAQWKQKIGAWREQRQHELTTPDGWLSLVGLEWLKSGGNSFGSAPDNSVKVDARVPEHFGLITVSGSHVQLLSLPGGFPPDLMINGQPAREGEISTDAANPSVLTWHSVTMVVLDRGGRFALRIKDANAPTRTGFTGLHWYAPDLHYAVAAKWTPYHPQHMEQIPTILGTMLTMPAPGVAEFTLDGKSYRLEPVLEDPHDASLFFILRDLTSQSTTYEQARFLRTPFPDHGLEQPGTLILDFNQLYNPPCAYTKYATCPLPPAQNRLPVAIEAGEKRYAPSAQRADQTQQ